jgi:hypothetical protein
LKVDITLVSQIFGGLILLIIGAVINRIVEKRSRLIAYYSHVGEFRLQPQGKVHTHSVVIRNNGRAKAENVHVPHHGMLKDANIHVSIDPSSIEHVTKKLDNDKEEILFPSLPAKFQVTVSYLYFPPIVAGQINAPIYSDEGPAKVIRVLPQQQYSTFTQGLVGAIMIVGAVTILYGVISFARWLVV